MKLLLIAEYSEVNNIIATHIYRHHIESEECNVLCHMHASWQAVKCMYRLTSAHALGLWHS